MQFGYLLHITYDLTFGLTYAQRAILYLSQQIYIQNIHAEMHSQYIHILILYLRLSILYHENLLIYKSLYFTISIQKINENRKVSRESVPHRNRPHKDEREKEREKRREERKVWWKVFGVVVSFFFFFVLFCSVLFCSVLFCVCVCVCVFCGFCGFCGFGVRRRESE